MLIQTSTSSACGCLLLYIFFISKVECIFFNFFPAFFSLKLIQNTQQNLSGSYFEFLETYQYCKDRLKKKS